MTQVKAPTDRSFGFTFVVVFALISAWQSWVGRPVAAAFILGFCATTLIVTLVRPATLGPLNKAWMKFGALLHSIVSPVVLGAMYFCVITPVALVMRIAGRDALRRRFDREASTYWIERTPPGPASNSLSDQF